MNKIIILLAITIFANLFLTGCGGGGGGGEIATVSGTVTDSEGDPVEGALVGVKDSNRATADADYYTVTDANGDYELVLNVTGTWYVAAWKEGWLPTADRVITSSGDKDLQLLQLADNLSLPDGDRSVFVWANSDDGSSIADYAADDDMNTRWSNNQSALLDNESWYIDLDTSGATHSIGGVTIYWEFARPKSYSIEYTADDPQSPTAGWTIIYLTATGDGYMVSDGKFVDPILFGSAVDARGIRVHCTERKVGYNGYSAWEIKIHSAT